MTRWVWSFEQARPLGADLLGGKGADLAAMVALGLPVPPGFVIGTPCGRAYLAHGGLPDGLVGEVEAQLAVLERCVGRRYGDDAAPLLVSVRSGAPVSMPGMTQTIHNVGLTSAGVAALAGETRDLRFAAGSFERLLHGFATTVRGIGVAAVEEKLLALPPGADAVARCEALQTLIAAHGGPFPDPRGQLLESIEAVFRSWMSSRAARYRADKAIDGGQGPAVVVQAMVFGNRGAGSGRGVAFTRDPSTGAVGSFGDFVVGAEREGERDSVPLARMGQLVPSAIDELQRVFHVLEADTRDLCDIDFTIDQGHVWVLRARVSQRTARAATRLAVRFANEGLISRREAVERVTEAQLAAARTPVFATEPAAEDVLARGVAASPGAVVGIATLTCRTAQERAAAGASVVLVRPATSPADLPGLVAAAAVVTESGGRASHAAVVARELDRPAVCGTGVVEIRDGETISVDGDRGVIVRGAQPLTSGVEDHAVATLMAWRDALRAAGVHRA